MMQPTFLEDCKTVQEIANWLLINSEYYFEMALEEAQEILEQRET